MPNLRGSILRTAQLFLQTNMDYSLALFYGREIFQYKFGLLPYRYPINAYVGEPIQVPPQLLDEYHIKYMNALTRLFDTYKAKHSNANTTITFVDDSDV